MRVWLDGVLQDNPPSGAAGGDLTGTYPSPLVAPLAITDAKVAAANKDGTVGTPSMRTLGAGAQQAAAGTAPAAAQAAAVATASADATAKANAAQGNATANAAALAAAAQAAAIAASAPALHAGNHVTGGVDVIDDAVAAGNSGLMSGADKTKLNGIAAGADVTATALGAILTTRGQILRRGVAALEALAAEGANTFLGGDGDDLVVRTAAQARTSLALDRRVAPDADDLIVLALDDAAGSPTIANAGASGGTMAVNGTPILGREGIHATCCAFKGNAADYLGGLSAVHPASAISVSCWLRVRTFAAARVVFRPYSAAWGAPWTSVSLYLNGSGVPAGSVNVGATERSPTVSAAVCQRGVWHHLGVCYDDADDTVRVYLDGSEVGSLGGFGGGVIDWGAADRDWRVGANDLAGAEALDGDVDDVRIAQVARPASWWREVYRRGIAALIP